jgi:hypothetical protein
MLKWRECTPKRVHRVMAQYDQAYIIIRVVQLLGYYHHNVTAEAPRYRSTEVRFSVVRGQTFCLHARLPYTHVTPDISGRCFCCDYDGFKSESELTVNTTMIVIIIIIIIIIIITTIIRFMSCDFTRVRQPSPRTTLPVIFVHRQSV